MIRALLLCAALQGCCLAPDSIRPEFEHMSHASQHFGPHQENVGSDIANVVAHWDLRPRLYFEIAEGVDIDQHHDGGYSGEIIGPREEFSARVGYVFKLKEK